MKILYSPAGDTDPIRNYHDGAILHIIRHYGIDKAIIFLSKEMALKEQERKIYSKAIKYVAPQCEVRFLESDLVEAHHLDKLLPLIKGFDEVLKEYPQEEIYLNLSSGTPQMKSVMAFLANDTLNVHAIQTDSPEFGSNRRAYANQDDEDIDTIIELNEDNAPDAKQRCYEAELDLIRFHSVRNQLLSLVRNYEYSGAWEIYKGYKRLFKTETGRLIEQGMLRRELRLEEAFKIPKVREKDRLREYLLAMELSQRQGKLADFIVKLTPFLYDLSSFYIEHGLNFKLSAICDGDKSHYKINLAKCEQVLPEFVRHVGYTFRDRTDLSFTNMLYILEVHEATDQSLLQELKSLRDVEKKNCNQIAHRIVKLTEEELRALEPHLDSSQIMEKLKQVFKLVLGKDAFGGVKNYDMLNREIEKSLAEYPRLG